VWDAASGVCLRVLEGHTSFVVSVTALGDGRLASASSDKTVRVWSAASGVCFCVLEEHTAELAAADETVAGLQRELGHVRNDAAASAAAAAREAASAHASREEAREARASAAGATALAHKSGSGRECAVEAISYFIHRPPGAAARVRAWSRWRGTTAQQQKGGPSGLGNFGSTTRPHGRGGASWRRCGWRAAAHTGNHGAHGSRRARRSQRARHDHGMHASVTAHAADTASALRPRRARYGHCARYGHGMHASIAARTARQLRYASITRTPLLNSCARE
jgi:hypothetical protein